MTSDRCNSLRQLYALYIWYTDSETVYSSWSDLQRSIKVSAMSSFVRSDGIIRDRNVGLTYFQRKINSWSNCRDPPTYRIRSTKFTRSRDNRRFNIFKKWVTWPWARLLEVVYFRWLVLAIFQLHLHVYSLSVPEITGGPNFNKLITRRPQTLKGNFFRC